MTKKWKKPTVSRDGRIKEKPSDDFRDWLNGEKNISDFGISKELREKTKEPLVRKDIINGGKAGKQDAKLDLQSLQKALGERMLGSIYEGIRKNPEFNPEAACFDEKPPVLMAREIGSVSVWATCREDKYRISVAIENHSGVDGSWAFGTPPLRGFVILKVKVNAAIGEISVATGSGAVSNYPLQDIENAKYAAYRCMKKYSFVYNDR